MDSIKSKKALPIPAEWNDTAVKYPTATLCLHQLIEEQVKRTPDLPAVAFEQQSLTYKELDRRAERLAHQLRGLGVGPDTRVGLFVERSIEMVVGLLGILKAGGAYMPIDTGFPQKRIEFMLEDAAVKVVLTQTSLRSSLPQGSVPKIDLDTYDWKSTTPLPKVTVPVHSGHLAYVIYTSGSTGNPKGVCIEHGNIVNYVLGVSDRLRLKPKMNYAMVSTIAADLCITSIFPPLATGGCSHVISQARSQSASMLSEYFASNRIDVLKIVPSHLAALQTGRNPALIMPKARLVLGGSAPSLTWIEQLRTLAPDCEIHNEYGPTETTVGVITFHVRDKVVPTQSGTLLIGKPHPNIRAYILDEKGQPVAVGVQGELLIGGLGCARGYLNRDDLTAEKFIADPFGSDPKGRMYRSGDLARYLPDGNIEFCGRIDHQVKIRGYRIELGELEETLCKHSSVREALVVARDDGTGNNILVAYVVPKRANLPSPTAAKGDVLTSASLRAFLKDWVPEYMVPSKFVLLEKFPLTLNGKIDTKALPTQSLEGEQETVSRVSNAPTTSDQGLHRHILTIWEKVLNRSSIGLKDNFFEIGGHSLLGITLVSELEMLFNKEVSLAVLFENPTIDELANTLSKDGFVVQQSKRK